MPVALGFGIGTPDAAAQAAAAGADGVIIGSRLVRAAAEASEPAAAVRELVADFAAALQCRVLRRSSGRRSDWHAGDSASAGGLVTGFASVWA